MKIKFIGAAGRVTGSCTLLHYRRTGIQFLVDCGMVQGEQDEEVLNSAEWPFSPRDLKFVLLTHAHLDHCGLIPRLYIDGFRGTVICTRFTAELTKLNLIDAAKHGAPYMQDDVHHLRFECIDERESFGFSRRLPIANDLFATFLRSAHIGGACGITLSWINEKAGWSEIHFSGDVGNNIKGDCYQSLLSHRQTAFDFPLYMVMESTYGDRKREPQYASYENRIAKLTDTVQAALRDRSGPLIIPCFSIHRTQEMLVDLHVVLEGLAASRADDESNSRPLFRSADILEQVLRNGVSSKHIEGVKSLIVQWPHEVQDEWLSWFIREDKEVDGHSVSNYVPKDRSEETLAIVREKLGLLRKGKSNLISVVIDSPLALKMCGVYAQELKRRQIKKPDEPMYRNRELAARLGCRSERELDRLLEKLLPGQDTPSATFGSYELRVSVAGRHHSDATTLSANTIFVTGGGMCEGGPVLNHLKYALTNKNATVLLTGYAPPQSIAGKLRVFRTMPEERRQTEALNITGTKIPYDKIEATIDDIGPFYSGHADQAGLIDYVFELRSKTGSEPMATRVFLNHGDDRKRIPLAEAIRDRVQNPESAEQRAIRGIEIPSDDLRWFDLEADAWIDEQTEPATFQSATDTFLEILAEQRKTNELLSSLIQMLGNCAPFGSKP